MKKQSFLLLFCSLLFYCPAKAQPPCQTEGNYISAVSVNSAGQPVIKWEKPANLPGNAIGYIIYNYVGGGVCTDAINSVDLNTYSYTHAAAAPLSGAHTYTIAVLTDKEPEPLTLQHAFSYLSASYDSCNYSISLQWTAYQGWEQPAKYTIYGGLQGQPAAILAENINATQYVLANVPDNVWYEIYVVAVNSSNTNTQSTSNRVSIQTTTAQRPGFMRINSLYYKDNTVLLDFAIDPTTALSTFHLMRSKQADGGYESIYSFADKTLQSYTNNNVETIYYYRLTAENYCRQEAAWSPQGNIIQLESNATNGIWHLSWNELYDSQKAVYSLNRLQPQPAQLLYQSDQRTYDDAIDINNSDLTYCYKVEALNSYGTRSATEKCMTYEPEILLPNAVDPTSSVQNLQTGRARNQFGPVVYAHPSTYRYQLEIYTKNGDKIAVVEKMETDSPLDKSWNGVQKNGQVAPEGMYTYHLKLVFTNGQTITKTGSVSVIYK